MFISTEGTDDIPGGDTNLAEQLIAACIPSDGTCDSSVVAMRIRRWFSEHLLSTPLALTLDKCFTTANFTGASYLIEKGFVPRGIAFFDRNESVCAVIAPDGSRRYCLPLDISAVPKELNQ